MYDVSCPHAFCSYLLLIPQYFIKEKNLIIDDKIYIYLLGPKGRKKGSSRLKDETQEYCLAKNRTKIGLIYLNNKKKKKIGYNNKRLS